MIKLIAETHTYVNDKFPNCKYKSVTSVLESYKEKFDSEYHASRVAARKGMTTEQVLEEWDKITKESHAYGHQIHEILERFLLSKDRMYSPRDEFEKVIINSFKNICEGEELSLIRNNDVLPEHIMSIEFNDEIGIAGTSDIIENLPDGRFNVWDHKTNKKFDYESKYNQYMYFPIDHLPYCKYSVYTMQISIYAFMYSRATGRKFNRAGLFSWDRYTQTFKLIPIAYMKREAEMLIDHYKIKLLGDDK